MKHVCTEIVLALKYPLAEHYNTTQEHYHFRVSVGNSYCYHLVLMVQGWHFQDDSIFLTSLPECI